MDSRGQYEFSQSFASAKSDVAVYPKNIKVSVLMRNTAKKMTMIKYFQLVFFLPKGHNFWSNFCVCPNSLHLELEHDFSSTFFLPLMFPKTNMNNIIASTDKDLKQWGDDDASQELECRLLFWLVCFAYSYGKDAHTGWSLIRYELWSSSYVNETSDII